MIKLENIEVSGWETAIRGMRNPMNSWDKSDSGKCCDVRCENCKQEYRSEDCMKINPFDYVVGKADLQLMKNLVAAGSDHAKFMRMINVTVDITAPLYWWKEFDTYKVGTVRNSCSTMHKIHEKEFTMKDFSYEHVIPTYVEGLNELVVELNEIRKAYIMYDELGKEPKRILETQGIHCKKDLWWQLIQLLPSSYNQRATVKMNYAVLRKMYHARKNHKLDEWRLFCRVIDESFPYSELITAENKPKPETRWIPCSERMPESGLTVHVFATHNDGCELYFDAHYLETPGKWHTYDITAMVGGNFFSFTISPDIKITHWMPIAEKPEV